MQLQCAPTNELISVAEPNKCQYLIQFNSPAACVASDLTALEQRSAEELEAAMEAQELEEENVI